MVVLRPENKGAPSPPPVMDLSGRLLHRSDDLHTAYLEAHSGKEEHQDSPALTQEPDSYRRVPQPGSPSLTVTSDPGPSLGAFTTCLTHQ